MPPPVGAGRERSIRTPCTTPGGSGKSGGVIGHIRFQPVLGFSPRSEKGAGAAHWCRATGGDLAVKRFVACWALVALPLVAFASGAGAVGGGACRITGRMVFSPQTETNGRWSIEDGIIDCQGLLSGGKNRIVGAGAFKGSGSYSALGGGGACLHQAGSGTLEDRNPTSGGQLLISEPDSETTAGPWVGGVARAAEGGDPASIGAFGAPFEEPTGHTCAKPQDPAPKCKPAAVALAVLPTSAAFYWDGLEGMNGVRYSTALEFGHTSQNDQSRVMDLSGPTPVWTVPNPEDGGAYPNGNPSPRYLPGVPHNNDNVHNDADLFCASLVQMS